MIPDKVRLTDISYGALGKIRVVGALPLQEFSTVLYLPFHC